MAQARKLHDQFFLQAKEDGYAARSAYKLKEIVDRKRIIRRGDRVIDLGCAPGSWVQVASELVGPGGRVGGIDLKRVEISLPQNARTMVGDIFQTDAEELLGLASDSTAKYNVLLSDMAPNTEGGGGGTIDHFRSIELCRRVLALAPALLRVGGSLAMKVFEGESYPDLLRDAEGMFDEAKGFKPKSSRDVSREMFIVCTGFKGDGPRRAPLPPGIAKAAPAPRAGWGAPPPPTGADGGGGRGGRR